MNWQVSVAKNGEATLKLNDVAIYSKYHPFEDAKRWVQVEVEEHAEQYLLIGLGLGYHLRALTEFVTTKSIIVYYFSQVEYDLFVEYNTDWWQRSNISLVSYFDNVLDTTKLQVLVPNVWVKAISEQHPLYDLLDTIKVNQQSYKKFASLMAQNAQINMAGAVVKPYPQRKANMACLIASGPSVQETLPWLAQMQQHVDIYVVGSALKLALQYNIQPTAVIITDAQPSIIHQLRGSGYNGILYYMLTANAEAVFEHRDDKYVICQSGYALSEAFAKKHGLPLLATGGSVSTTAFSLIEYMGYNDIVLFGQDFGFAGNQTHAVNSTSGKILAQKSNYFVLANDESLIQTQPNLRVYLRWFDAQCAKTKMNVYNTAKKGAKIRNVPLIDQSDFIEIFRKVTKNV